MAKQEFSDVPNWVVVLGFAVLIAIAMWSVVKGGSGGC